MNAYRQAGRAPVEEGHRPRVDRRKLFWALLPFVAWVGAQVVFALYVDGLSGLVKLALGWVCVWAVGYLIAKMGLAIQAYLAKRRPDFARDQLARETEAFLKETEEAARQPYRVEAAPTNDAVASEAVDDEATESARELRKAGPW